MTDNIKTLHEKLTDEGASFLKKLRIAIAEGQLDY
jgi:hypothetical protein